MRWSRNTATRDEIGRHYAAVNFSSALRAAVTDNYIDKIMINAERFECWDGPLIGLAAIYMNRPPAAFLTMLSVLPTQSGRGIAKGLIVRGIDLCRTMRFSAIELEVEPDNISAISVYEHLGFIKGLQRMTLTLC